MPQFPLFSLLGWPAGSGAFRCFSVSTRGAGFRALTGRDVRFSQQPLWETVRAIPEGQGSIKGAAPLLQVTQRRRPL